MGNPYNVAIYCRLSREDENFLESESIKNQVEFITKYVVTRGWSIIDIYIDDGYTGSNFDRPAFKNMLSDIENGKINTVITKDLSRLGRDYIETGHYIEKFFPENNIRYIAINDGIDTFEDNIGNEMSPFKSVINDLYSKDISKKVKSVLKSKVESGKFIGAFAPYGYKKHPDNKNMLVVDNATAHIVKRIFQEYLSGTGLSRIANMLNGENIPCPSKYKAMNTSYNNKRAKNNLWGHCSIKSILINPTYTGNVTQHKFKKLNYKSRKLIAIDQSNWISVNNTHEPIISIEKFKAVQEIMQRRSNQSFCSKRTTRLFSGFVFCKQCGQYMTFSKTPKGVEYLICSTYKRFTSKYCSRHAIKLSIFKHAILQDMIHLFNCILIDRDMLKGLQTRHNGRESNMLQLLLSGNITMTRELLGKFIKKIEVSDDSSIIISYNFKNPCGV